MKESQELIHLVARWHLKSDHIAGREVCERRENGKGAQRGRGGREIGGTRGSPSLAPQGLHQDGRGF